MPTNSSPAASPSEAESVASPPVAAQALAGQAPAAQAATLAGSQAVRPEPSTAAQSAARPARSERTKSETAEAPASGVTAPVTASKTAQAGAASGATTPPVAEAEAALAQVADAAVEADTPEYQAQAEARPSGESATPAALAGQAVRGSPETVANLAAQILKKLDARSTRFDLELNPGGLGKVDVRIDIGANGQLTAAMTFDNAGAASDLKARAGDLQKALEQAGFDLSGGLTFDVAQDRGQQQRQAQQDHADSHAGFRGQAFRAALGTAGDAADAAVQGALRLRRGVTAGLDVRI